MQQVHGTWRQKCWPRPGCTGPETSGEADACQPFLPQAMLRGRPHWPLTPWASVCFLTSVFPGCNMGHLWLSPQGAIWSLGWATDLTLSSDLVDLTGCRPWGWGWGAADSVLGSDC